MTDVGTVREAIATRLRTINGLNVYSEWQGNINFPCAIVVPQVSEMGQTMGRIDFSRFEFDIVVAMNMAGTLENAQQRVDALTSNTGTESILAALDTDRTLGGIGNLIPLGWSRPDMEEINGPLPNCLVQRLSLDVWAN